MALLNILRYPDARLHKLAAPPVMAPAYRAELRTLAGSRAAAAELAAELRRPVRTHVTELGRAFAVAVRGASSVSAQRGQIAAIKAYNERVRTIAALQERVRSELARLQRT